MHQCLYNSRHKHYNSVTMIVKLNFISIFELLMHFFINYTKINILYEQGNTKIWQ